MSEEENQFEQEDNGKRWPLWWIVFPILLIVSLGVSGYLYYKVMNGKAIEAQYNEAVTKHDEEKKRLSVELDEIKAKLEEAMRNNTSLLATNGDLQGQLDEKTLALARKIKSAGVGNPKALREAKEEIERLKSLKQIFEQKVDSLSQSNRELIAKVLQTESEVEVAQNKANEIEAEKKVLDEKVKNSILAVSDLRVVGMRKKGSSEEETFRAFKTDRLKISFTILGNELIEAGEKPITIRLIGTNKEVLTNENEKLTDTDKLVTMVQNIDYQNEPIKTTIYYNQKAAYKKGNYTIELIHNDKLMGRAAFILR